MPDASGDRSWTSGETLEVRLTFSEAVTVAGGPPTVGVTIAGEAATLDYASGSGSAVLSFSRAVTDADGSLSQIAVTADSLALAAQPSDSDTRHLTPDPEGTRAQQAMVDGAQEVTAETEQIQHDAVHRQETLRVRSRLEAPHLAFPLSRRLVRDFGAVVRILIRAVDYRRHHHAARRGLGAQLAISVNNCPPPRDPRSRMTSFKRTQRKYVQKAYRVRNWREYETGLRARGSLTVWLGLTDGKLANWHSPRPTRRKPGRQRKYSNHAIETTVTLGLVFGLASRQTEGFLRSLLTLLSLDNDVPDHSTISRRKARLGKVASYERRTVKPVHLRIDSSGLSVHVGQLRTPPKARDYRKLHLAVDEHTSDVVACELTSKRARDASRVASLVGQIERPIASAKADAAYDTGDV